MKANLLFAATLAMALASSLALADETQGLTRAQVIADFHKANANGTLQRTDYDQFAHESSGTPRSRDDVIAAMKPGAGDQRMVGPMRSGLYNPWGVDFVNGSKLQRSEVQAGVVSAMRDGTLRRTDYDDVNVRSARVPQATVAPPVVAGTRRSVTSGS